jgi:hydroxyacylglutathione hydrolase
MHFQQFYLGCLAHASYLLGAEGIAAIVDPQRDVELYLEEAARLGLKIAYVVETHLHADFVSGHRELAARTGAKIYLGARAGAAFPHHPIAEGDTIRFGRCVLRFLETPGHTPESVCVLVTDLERSPEPWAVLTGDTLFLGDVGRPDLSPEFTPQQLAGMLYDSLHTKLLTLPDEVEVYPAHGAGSLCGRNISNERRSTIGQQRQFNYALQVKNRDDFVRLLTTDLPERPGYFARDAEINRSGAAALSELAPLASLSPEEFRRKQDEGAIVLDTRPAAQFGGGHIPGSVHIALSGQFASWAGALIGLDRPLLLIAEDPEHLAEARMRLARVGIENAAGTLEGGLLTWQRAGLPLEEIPQISVVDLHREITERPGEVQVVDVRNAGEWQAGHVREALHKPLSTMALDAAISLLGHVNGQALDPNRPLAVHCKSGYRSSIASSLLQRAGFRQVLNVTGGFDAWTAQKFPVETAERAATP